MTDKQMEEKKREFRELEVRLYREMKENAKVTGVHDLDELDEKKWQWIEKLVEEVERECNKGKLRIERGRSSREYRLVCAMCNGDKSEFCRFCEGMGSHMITFN